MATAPKARPASRMQNVIVERRPRSRTNGSGGGHPIPRREPLNPALTGLATLKLKSATKVPGEALEAAPAPEPVPSAVCGAGQG